MIERIPDDNMYYVINILQNLEAMSVNKPTDKEQAITGLENGKEIARRL